MKNITYIITLAFILFGCITSKSDMKVESNDKSIDATIALAKVEISNHLKKNGINPVGKQMIFKSFGRTEGESEEKRCELFDKQEGYDFINENITIGSNWVTAMILDKKGQYLASSSTHTLIKHPEQLNAYPFELKLIELAQKENYLTYIELINCNENYIIGYKKNAVDVYKYKDDDLTLIYTK